MNPSSTSPQASLPRPGTAAGATAGTHTGAPAAATAWPEPGRQSSWVSYWLDRDDGLWAPATGTGTAPGIRRSPRSVLAGKR